MEIMIADKMKTLEKITPSQYKKLLKDAGNKKNILVYGKSGTGKSGITDEYAQEEGLTHVLIPLATEMPEAIGGIPHAISAGEYFIRLLDKKLEPVFKTKGKGFVLDFEEINQGLPEVQNALYSICHPDPKARHWAGHSLEFAQIVANGNLSDGTDGTVYLNELPTPLHNRFHIFEMIPNKSDTTEFLKKKWENIPQVTKYIEVLLEENIPPRDIDGILETIAYKMDSLWISAKIGEELTIKLLNIRKKVESVDPSEALKSCRKVYEIYKKYGRVKWAGNYIEDEQKLLDEFKALLSEEEIKSIVKGDE